MYPICVECLQTAFYTDWVHLRVIVPTIFAATFMYPICVECLQSAFYTDWVQETISKNAKITFSQKYTQSVQKACTQVYASILHRLGIQSFLAFFEDVPNLCRMLAHRYMQAFYTDWVHKIDPHTFSTQIGYILKNVPNLCRMLAHILEVMFSFDQLTLLLCCFCTPLGQILIADKLDRTIMYKKELYAT